jgi:hypothetical protein
MVVIILSAQYRAPLRQANNDPTLRRQRSRHSVPLSRSPRYDCETLRRSMPPKDSPTACAQRMTRLAERPSRRVALAPCSSPVTALITANDRPVNLLFPRSAHFRSSHWNSRHFRHKTRLETPDSSCFLPASRECRADQTIEPGRQPCGQRGAFPTRAPLRPSAAPRAGPRR